MRTVIKNATLIDGQEVFVSVRDGRIEKISASPIKGDEYIEARGCLLIPGFYNTHCHSAMTFLRGYADDLSLREWLFERIFPAEDRMDADVAYDASMLAIAEMLAGGTVSFSDMYMFMDATARAVAETGIKANLARGYSSDGNTTAENDRRLAESLALYREYNGYGDGRVIVDLSVHAEYTNVPSAVERIADAAAKLGARVQIHLSETESEHEGCIERYGKTPAEWFESLGILDLPVCAAHCVYVNDGDIGILSRHGVSVAHCPSSNLKLGSGIMPLERLRRAGVNIALGTDGASSNNRLDMLRELQLAALIHKGVSRDPRLACASDVLTMATANGAAAQGRDGCGSIEVGKRADLVLLDLEAPHNVPCYDPLSAVAYSASASDVRMTMVDGRVLYLNGEYKTLDIEKVRSNIKRDVQRINLR